MCAVQINGTWCDIKASKKIVQTVSLAKDNSIKISDDLLYKYNERAYAHNIPRVDTFSSTIGNRLVSMGKT